MFAWMRHQIVSALKDPFTGDAMVANSEFVAIPKEESVSRPFALEFPRVSRRLRVHHSYATERRRRLRQYRIRAHASFLAILLGAGLLLGATGTEHLPTMIGGGATGLLLLVLGLAGFQES